MDYILLETMGTNIIIYINLNLTYYFKLCQLLIVYSYIDDIGFLVLDEKQKERMEQFTVSRINGVKPVSIN